MLTYIRIATRVCLKLLALSQGNCYYLHSYYTYVAISTIFFFACCITQEGFSEPGDQTATGLVVLRLVPIVQSVFLQQA